MVNVSSFFFFFLPAWVWCPFTIWVVTYVKKVKKGGKIFFSFFFSLPMLPYR